MRSLGSPPQVRGKPGEIKAGAQMVGITPAGAGKTIYRSAWRQQCRDHPRRCGENGIITLSAAVNAGSPPQVRGKRALRTLPLSLPRITPAGAGKTRCYVQVCIVVRDHPRRCGENPTTWGLSAYCPGSPPQVRGKPPGEGSVVTYSRITPAGAGKTGLYLCCIL